MKITWIGHACFKVEDSGASVVLDPYSDGSVPGLLPVREKAGMVLCSHGHGDHNAAGNVEIMNEPGAAFKITKIDTYHDDVITAQLSLFIIMIKRESCAVITSSTFWRRAPGKLFILVISDVS